MIDELRVRSADGRWEVIGRDRLRGVSAVVTSVEADTYGPKALAATLSRDPSASWPDLAAATPLEYHRDGVWVWSGRVASSPTRDELDGFEIALVGDGVQASLDDDVTNRFYAIGVLSDLKDARNYSALSLLTWKPQGVVEVGNTVRLAWPKGADVATNDRVGVVFDMGAVGRGWNILYDVAVAYTETSTGGSLAGWLIETHGADNLADTAQVPTGAAAIYAGVLGGGAATYTRTAISGRYVVIDLVRSGGAGATTQEASIALTDIAITPSTFGTFPSGVGGWRSGAASTLKASDVAKTIPYMVPGFSQDLSGIAASTFSIPDLATRGLATPREILDLANAYEYRQWFVDARRRLNYRAFPTAPDAETIGPFEDSAAGSIDETYTRVLVEGGGLDGNPVVGQAFTAPAALLGDDPDYTRGTDYGFEPAGVGSWTGSTLARSTTAPYGGTGCGGVTVALVDTENYAFHTIAGLVPGRSYGVELAVRKDHATSTGTFYLAAYDSFLGISGGSPFGQYPYLARNVIGRSTGVPVTFPTVGAWNPFRVQFVAPPSGSIVIAAVWTHAAAFAAGSLFSVDELRVLVPTTNAVDRQKITRTLVVQPSLPLSQAAADAIASVFAANIGRDQFAGTVRVQRGQARTVVGGMPVDPVGMLGRVGELLRLPHLREPSTGGMGRDGRIVAVQYDPQTDTANVALDSTTTRLDAWLARVSAIAARRGVGGAV